MDRLYPQDLDLHTLSPLALAFVGGGATVGGIGALVYFLMKKRR